MVDDSSKRDVQEALRLIDEFIVGVLPQVSVDSSPIQGLNLHVGVAANNGGDGVRIGHDVDIGDIDVNGQYHVVQELAETARLVEEGVDENSGVIEQKLEWVAEVTDAPSKVANIAAALSLFL